METAVGGLRMTAKGRSIPTGRGYPTDAEAARPDSRERIADGPEGPGAAGDANLLSSR